MNHNILCKITFSYSGHLPFPLNPLDLWHEANKHHILYICNAWKHKVHLTPRVMNLKQTSHKHHILYICNAWKHKVHLTPRVMNLKQTSHKHHILYIVMHEATKLTSHRSHELQPFVWEKSHPLAVDTNNSFVFLLWIPFTFVVAAGNDLLQMLIGMVQGLEQDKRLASLCSVAIDVTTIM